MHLLLRNALLAAAAVSYLTSTACAAKPSVTQAQADVVALDAWLSDIEHGDAWRDYLHWSDLQRSVNGAGSDSVPGLDSDADQRLALTFAVARLERDAPGLELEPFARVRSSLNAALQQLPPLTANDTVQMVRLATQFPVIADAKASEQTKQVLQQAASTLDARLTADGANGAAWRSFLRWERLNAVLETAGAVDLAAIDAALVPFESQVAGLETPVFQHVADALRAYRQVAATVEAASSPSPEDRLAALATALSAYTTKPDAQARTHIADTLAWLDQSSSHARLASLVREQYAQPNLLVEASERFVADELGRPVNQAAPIRDCILGTSISGCGFTTGQVQVNLVPNVAEAAIETLMQGVNRSRTVGRNGPAIICSSGVTCLFARRELRLSGAGFAALPVSASAHTSSQITGIGSTKQGFVDRIVRKVASKKAAQSKGSAERIASQHAQQRLAAQFQEESTASLAEANDAFQNRFRQPLSERGLFPRTLKFSTTEDRLFATALQAGDDGLGAPSPAPQLPAAAPELGLRLHESAFNSMAAGLLSGKTLDRANLTETSMEILGRVPDRLMQDEDGLEWSITFPPQDPVTLTVDDGQVTITIRGAGFTSGDRKYDAMNITARYQVAVVDGQIRAIRQGDLEILPGYEVGSGTLPLRYTVLRNRLQRRFGDVLRPEIDVRPLTIGANLNQPRSLSVGQLLAEDGWLAVAWE